MGAGVGVALLVVALGVVGLAFDLAGASPRNASQDSPAFDTGMRTLFAGLAATSLYIMLLALFGVFSLGAVLGGAGILAAGAWWRASRAGITLRNAVAAGRQSLRAWLAVAAATVFLAWAAPPFDAKLAASDASVYLAAAAYVAESGGLSGTDPLVAQMTRKEREAFFVNRFSGGAYARFPGGVPLIDPAVGIAGFYYYHLWPVWLALGLEVLGDPAFLALLSMFGAMSLAALFLIGSRLADRGVGAAAALMLAASFPQVYHLRMPLSEVPAQAFFLCGSYAFVEAVRHSGLQRRNWQWLAAALWGAFCLTRADGVLFLFPAIALAFVACGDLRRSLAQWLPLGFGLLCLAALAFLHQLAGGVYTSALVKLAGIGPTLGMISDTVQGSEKALAAAWLALAATAVCVVHRGLGARTQRLAVAVTVAAFVLVGSVWLVRFVPRFEGSELVRHLRWIVVYLPNGLPIGIAVGFALLGTAIVREPSRMRLAVALLPFLLVPMASFLIDPWVRPSQPWAIRRMVPMAFPLLLVLALLGWHLGLSAIAARTGKRFRAASTVLGVGVAAYFLTASWFLWREPLFQDVSAQVHDIARKLPPAALVLIPEGEAGMHLQAALQYGEDRETLLVPIEGSSSDLQAQHRMRFLRQQVASGRPVVALANAGPPFADQLLEHFALEPLFVAQLVFSTPLQTPELEFPRGIDRVQASYPAFRLRERGLAPIPERIAIGRPAEDIAFIAGGFHGPEGDPASPGATFRWTTEEAEILLPRVRSVKVHLNRWRPPQAPPLQLAVLVDGQPVAHARALEDAREVIEFALPPAEGARADPARVTLRSNPFSMTKLGLSDDPRELGLMVFGLELSR